MALLRLTEKDLVQRVCGGDGEAFNRLVSRWEKKLFNYAYRLTGNREEAFDVCQDSFIRAYEQIRQLKEPAKFSNWLFRIARNYCISRYRAEQGMPRIEARPDEEEGPDLENLLATAPPVRMDSGQSFETSELRLMLERAMDYLPFEQRETIVLKIFEGLKFAEIAEIAECPVSTVKSRLYLGMIQLKKILEQKPKD